MILRSWQYQCSKAAIAKFIAGQKFFLALATPGSGKTVMAATVAKELFDRGMIDYVICFAPSVAVLNSTKQAFARVLGKGMDGYIGDVGAAFSYQYLSTNQSNEWTLLKNHRVFVVFDEIHHAGGDIDEFANAWGKQIIRKIRTQASYILSMTGTPWRSDKSPITLAKYLEPDNKIQCDFSYGITAAIADEVCRVPQVNLIDNDRLIVDDQSYDNLCAALTESQLTYTQLLEDRRAVYHLLSLSVSQLKKVRLSHPTAGGLVVAKSVEHAWFIYMILNKRFNQSAVLVTYQDSNAQAAIEDFRHSSVQWIISVAMVTEGTDIPRLRVCAHLSTVRTELFFRQVLGRVLRRMSSKEDAHGWLFSFAEPSLLKFAKCLQQDIPESVLTIIKSEDITKEPVENDLQLRTQVAADIEKIPPSFSGDWPENCKTETNVNLGQPLLFSLEGDFREKVYSIFSKQI